MNKNLFKQNKGIAALLTVIIIGVSAVIMATSASFLSLGELDMGFSSVKGSETYYFTEGCAEEALRRIRLDTSYEVTDLNFSLGERSCIINVSAENNDRVIVAFGNIGDYYKNIQVELSLQGDKITISNWEEIDN